MKKAWMVALATFVAVIALGAVAYAMAGPETTEDNVAGAALDQPLQTEKAGNAGNAVDDLELIEKTEQPGKTDGDLKLEEKETAEKEHDPEPVDEKKVDAEPADEDDKAAFPPVPPKLTITYPEDGAGFTEAKLVFQGTATPGSVVMAGKYEADVDAEGNWAIKLVLQPGSNKAVFVAENESGRTDASVVVHLEVKDGDKTEQSDKGEKAEADFTAEQVYGYCEEPVPYDVFWGTTAPGAEVFVFSEFGSAETVANDKGEYELRVDFPYAPYGDSFVVYVKSMGLKKAFEFTSYANNSHDLVAYQVYGQSETEVPRDVFWGTTAPYAEVLIWSEFGMTTTTADGEGAFEVEATFPDAPHDVPFTVKVKSIDQKVVFDFVSKYQPEGEGA